MKVSTRIVNGERNNTNERTLPVLLYATCWSASSATSACAKDSKLTSRTWMGMKDFILKDAYIVLWLREERQ